MIRIALIGGLAGLGMLLGMPPGETTPHLPHDRQIHDHQQPGSIEPADQFQQINQPLWVKAAVTTGGLGLIGLELWWFLLSKPKSR